LRCGSKTLLSFEPTQKPAGAGQGGGAMLQVLGRANSFNVRKVLWLCDEIGIPYERQDYGRGFRPTNTPEFLKINPMAQVPAVIDGTFVMRESNTIVRYLAAKHGAKGLYPDDLQTRALIEQWMDWVAYDVTHALRGAFLGGQLGEAPWDNPWFVAQGRSDLTHLMALLDKHLTTGGPYMLGKDFTLADIPVGLVVNRWFTLAAIERPNFPALLGYYDLLTQRAPYRAHGRNGLP
jgi:glutathione S-transferase